MSTMLKKIYAQEFTLNEPRSTTTWLVVGLSPIVRLWDLGL